MRAKLLERNIKRKRAWDRHNSRPWRKSFARMTWGIHFPDVYPKVLREIE